jgi:hypothetical protein
MRSGIIHRPEVIFAIQTQAADLFAHHLSKLRLHLFRQGDSSEAENRYAEAVFQEYPQEEIVRLFKLSYTMWSIIVRFIFDTIIKYE